MSGSPGPKQIGYATRVSPIESWRDKRSIGEESQSSSGSVYKAPETLGGSPVNIRLDFEDVDAFFKRALAAGAKERKPVMDEFYGDRVGPTGGTPLVISGFGHT